MPSVRDTIRELIDSGRELADAEVARAKAMGSYAGSVATRIAIFGATAFVLLFATIVTLMVGLVFVLAPYIGRGLALLAVVGVAILIALGCGLAIKAYVGRLKRLGK
jgi:hypothetical protein